MATNVTFTDGVQRIYPDGYKQCFVRMDSAKNTWRCKSAVDLEVGDEVAAYPRPAPPVQTIQSISYS